MQCTEFTCPRRKNEFWQTASTHDVPVYAEECVVKLSIKVKARMIRKTTCASKGPEVTLLNIWGREGLDVWCNSWETEIKIADVEL